MIFTAKELDYVIHILCKLHCHNTLIKIVLITCAKCFASLFLSVHDIVPMRGRACSAPYAETTPWIHRASPETVFLVRLGAEHLAVH